MTNQINSCIEKLVTLHIPADQTQWQKNTNFQSPCKPLLLLAVIDMTANGSLQENFIEPSFELAIIYNRYWQAIETPNTDNNLATTFLDLENDGFWKMTGQGKINPAITTMRELHKSYVGAKIDANFFPLLTSSPTRKKLRETLITTYFNADIQPALMDVALVNHGAALYSKELVNGAPGPQITTGRDEKIDRQIAELGFDSAIVKLYDHRCAICGIKLITPEGHSAVKGVHIVPWRISKDDHPNNGLALCEICSWSFKNGMLGVNEKNKVVIPTAIRLNGNLPGHMLIFTDKVLSRPKQKEFKPSQENLEWHRENVLRD